MYFVYINFEFTWSMIIDTIIICLNIYWYCNADIIWNYLLHVFQSILYHYLECFHTYIILQYCIKIKLKIQWNRCKNVITKHYMLQKAVFIDQILRSIICPWFKHHVKLQKFQVLLKSTWRENNSMNQCSTT